MNESQRHYPVGKKPDTEQYTLYDVIHMKSKNRPSDLIQCFSTGVTELPRERLALYGDILNYHK